MIRNLILLAVLIGAAALYTLYDGRTVPAPETQKDSATAQSQKTPDFKFISLDGKTHSLSGFSGKVIVLNFWASWCAPCVIEFPQMIDLASKTKSDSIFIFMSADEDKADIENFLKKQKGYKGENIFIAHDADKSISQKLFQTYKLPETYIIAPDMTISEKIVGADIVWNAPEMVQKIKNFKK